MQKFKRSKEWQRCLEYWNHACAVCGRTADENYLIAADHWQPFLKGNTIATNMIPLCHAKKGSKGGCNNNKYSFTPDEYFQRYFDEKIAAQIRVQIEAYFDWVRNQ